jgi:hypothetical protein
MVDGRWRRHCGVTSPWLLLLSLRSSRWPETPTSLARAYDPCNTCGPNRWMGQLIDDGDCELRKPVISMPLIVISVASQSHIALKFQIRRLRRNRHGRIAHETAGGIGPRS